MFSNRLFISTVPKSGTHLIRKAIELVGYQHNQLAPPDVFSKAIFSIFNPPRGFVYEPILHSHLRRLWSKFSFTDEKVFVDVTTPIEVPLSLMNLWLRSISIGGFMIGHVPFCDQLYNLLMELNYKIIVMIRDPRDVVVSFLHYVKRPQHVLYPDFKDLGRLEAMSLLIHGGVARHSGRVILPISESFRLVSKWQEKRGVFLMRFEDLIGRQGGGNTNKQISVLSDLLDFLDVRTDTGLIEGIIGNIYDINAKTFRKGRIGAWREELTRDELEMITATLSDLAEAMGYENLS